MSIDFIKGYDAEIIEGFEVTSMMKRFWASCLENLIEFDRICVKNNIHYFLFYGSLLGAARHNGFIPWDDDLDVAMLRDDYEKFIEVAKKDLCEPFFLSHIDYDSCLACCCMHNSYVPQIGKDFLDRFHGCPYPNGLDIYPLDNIPDDKNDLHEFSEIYKVVKYLAQRTDPAYKNNNLPQSFQKYVDHPTDDQIEEVVQEVEKYLRVSINRSDEMHKDLSRLANVLSQRYNKKKCKRVGYINDINLDVNGKLGIPRKYLEEQSELEFEGIKFPVPKNYENVLSCLYGEEWKKPVKGAASHDYPCYKGRAIQLKAIFEGYGAPAPDYFYI